MLDYNAELFRKNFGETQDGQRRIVVYGLGKQTEAIIKEFPGFPIMGLLDGYREEGEIYGKKILALSSLAGQKVKIVIAARKASERIIYKRIREFCKEQDIPVYRLDGTLLNEEPAENAGENAAGKEEAEYFRRNRKELEDRIDACDTVSFDIFDTLLTRKVLCREDVFRVAGGGNGAGRDFPKLRMRAELELSRKGDPSIYEIYQWIGEQIDMDSDTLARIMEDEIAIEKLVLVPRKAMAEVFQYAIDAGKRVYLISDMYLPGNILDEILKENGICGYDHLFVSCDYGTSKAENLYDIYQRNSQGHRRLHIGDSEEMDGKAAEVYGMEVYLIKAPQEMAGLTAMGRALLQKGDAFEVQGMLYARLFNNPFVLFESGGRVKTDSPFDLGYGILGPVLAGYMHWLCRKAVQEQIEVLLFIARDGYLMKQAFDRCGSLPGYEKLPEAVYFMISRSFAVFTSIQNEEDILNVMALPFEGSAEEMLQKRFMLEKANILSRTSGEEDLSYVMRHASQILARAAEARSGYQRYLFSCHLQDKKVGLFDFVSTGTCQMCLEKIAGISIKGYYFEHIMDSDERKKGLDIADFVHDHDADYESDNYFLLELWLKATHPSIKYVMPNGKVQYYEQRYSWDQQECIRRIQEGALRFCEDFFRLPAQMAAEKEIEPFALSLLPFIKEEYISIDLKNVKNYDEFVSRVIEIG